MDLFLIYKFGEGFETTFVDSRFDLTSSKKILQLSIIMIVLSKSWVDSIRISLLLNESLEEDFSCDDEFED